MESVSQRKKGGDPLVVLVGPTASGKSALGVRLAKKFSGEVVSADSRQVYVGLDLGSGKITTEEMRGVPHHLLSLASPRRRFTVAQFQKQATRTISGILKRNHLPFLVGGSRLYIDSILKNTSFPEVRPDTKLRGQLEKKTPAALFSQLKKLDPRRARHIDANNKRRLIRAIEIVLRTGKVVPEMRTPRMREDVLLLGIAIQEQKLKENITKRLAKRLHHGMVSEVRKLHDSGLSFKRLESFGLEYRHVAQYLQGKISKEEMQEKIVRDSLRLAKLQLKWFAKDKRIRWVRTKKEAERLVADFLKQKSSSCEKPFG
ncbi:MAG: tRNA (adenosine(37)-N6)-dimethylallyltransferase MiaA [Candidatus Pacearchaeota archaeon]|nr:tRNA (adenosine(37)-N6)-dimethylallyltransferase MiaA [Candidatus Pacearchaeota archaeon]